MRIYEDCRMLMSELFRDVMEMGVVTHSISMQNKVVGDDPNFDTKEIINYSYCLQSLLNEDFLFITDPDSKLWVQSELGERLNVEVNPGYAWKIRKDVWEKFLVDGKFDYTYSERLHFHKSMAKVINALRDNPHSRQAILSIWRPDIDVDNLNGKKRVPCSIYYQLLYRDDKLHIIYNQRSADAFTHLGNDIWLAYNLMVSIAYALGFKPGYLYHNIGSLHAYRKDWDNMRKSLEDLSRG